MEDVNVYTEGKAELIICISVVKVRDMLWQSGECVQHELNSTGQKHMERCGVV